MYLVQSAVLLLHVVCLSICDVGGSVLTSHSTQNETIDSHSILGYVGVLGYFWGTKLFPVQNLTSYSCSATSISREGDEISRLSLSFRDLTRDRQTDDRGDDRNRRLSHCKCSRLISHCGGGRSSRPISCPILSCQCYMCFTGSIGDPSL